MAEPVRFQHFEVPLREDGSLFELGRGAMGITYKAFDTNLRCFVALKVINSAYLGSEVARQRFLREARAAAALRHPNVATVFHLGEEEGNCFYAMEFVDGETVEAMMKREGSIPVAIALQIVIQVARALGAAQKQGLVHRDIKPSNLMLVREDDTDFTVKVIDFGLAKNAGGGGEETATLTMGGFLGTPHFASPEQLEERDLDVRSDIYSLGVTLYYMLAGRAPFSGSLAQVMSQHLHREPPLETLAGQKPEVIALLKHMLAKDPGGRQQTPADLRREAEACLESIGKAAGEAEPPVSIDAECFETQVLDAPDSSAGPAPAPGVTLAGRYRIVREIRSSDLGRVFEAENLESRKPVALILASPGLAPSAEALTRLEERIMALQRLSAPALQRMLSLERVDHISFLTAEWIDGPCLLDLIKARRSLPLDEALEILRPLAAGFHALQSAGLSCPDISSNEILLPGFDISQPLPPGVAVKFLPLSPEAATVSPDTTLVTSAFAMMRDSGAFSALEPKSYIFAVAALAYEILGGLKSAAGGAVPIPGLSEATNSSLRRALDPSESFESLEDFLSALTAGSAPRPQVPKPVQNGVPPALPVAAKPGRSRLVGACVVALVFLALAGGGAYWWSSRRDAGPPAPSSPTPTPPPAAAVAASSATPSTSATPAAAPAATPAPTPGVDPVAEGLLRAREIAASEPAEALKILVGLVKSHPDRPEPREAITEFLTSLRGRHDVLTPGQTTILIEPLEDAAALDFVDAQLLLGEQLLESDPRNSLKWLLAAAKNDNTSAMLLAGLSLAKGVGGASPDLPEAARWFQRAAEGGEPRAMFALGECYYFSKGVTRDPRLALEWLGKASARNDVRALNMMGDLYNKGIPGVLPKDVQKAFASFTAAKDLGYAPAFGNLGALFMTAPEGMRDKKLAVDLFRQGAERGDLRSMYFYAGCLNEGLGDVPVDKEAAKSWFVKAAELGHAEARAWCKANNVPFNSPPLPAR